MPKLDLVIAHKVVIRAGLPERAVSDPEFRQIVRALIAARAR